MVGKWQRSKAAVVVPVSLVVVLLTVSLVALTAPSSVQSHTGRGPVESPASTERSNAKDSTPASPTRLFADSVIATIPVGSDPTGIAFNNYNGDLYVSGDRFDNVTVINGTNNTVVASIPVGYSPAGIVATSFGDGNVYVANLDSHNVSVISGATNTVVGSVNVGIDPLSLAVDGATGTIYVVDESSNNVSLLNGTTNSNVGSVAVGNPRGVAYDSLSGYVFVTNDTSSGIVTVINGTTEHVVTSFSVGGAPLGATFDRANGVVYVMDSFTGGTCAYRLYVINGTSLNFERSTIIYCGTEPYGPSAVAVDGVNDYLYVANSGSNTVTVLNSTTGENVTSIPVGEYPQSIAFDSANDDLYVTNEGSANVSVLNGSINYPEIRTLSADPSTVDVGVATTLNVDATGGVGARTYKYTGLPLGCETESSSLLPCTPLHAGNYTIRVFVNDTAGNSANLTTLLSVNAAPGVYPSANPSPTDARANTTFNATVSGGTGPFGYTWLFGDGTEGTGQSTIHSFTSAGHYSVQVYANDTFGLSSNGTFPVTVYPRLLATLEVSNSTPLLGQTVAFVTNATGGLGPYNYSYSGFPPGCVTEDKPAVGCLPTQADLYNVTVYVRDKNNVTVDAMASVRVIFDFNVIVPTNTSAGSPFTISVNTNETFSGGTALAPAAGIGALTYNYSGLPPGCASADLASITCTPTQIGTYHIDVSVHDQVGDHNSHTVVVNVLAPKATTGTSGIFGLSGDTGYLLLGGTVATAAVLVGVFFLSRKRRTRSRRAPGREDRLTKDGESPPETSAASPPAGSTKQSEGSGSSGKGTVTVTQTDWDDMKSRLEKLEKK